MPLPKVNCDRQWAFQVAELIEHCQFKTKVLCSIPVLDSYTQSENVQDL